MNWIKPDWPAAKHIHAAVTLRTGGVSQNEFKDLNPALHVNDDSKAVYENRKIIAQMLNLPAEPVWMKQVHSNRIIKATPESCIEQADGSYTELSRIVCVVLTADCLPVLLATMDGKKIAALHAGWRGLLAGVITNAVKALGSDGIIVWLGPAIGPDCFEVGHEVRNKFVNKSTVFAKAFRQKGQYKFLANIYQLATIELSMMGVTEVYGGGFCTMKEKERFYSFRRDGDTGRMATLIWRD